MDDKMSCASRVHRLFLIATLAGLAGAGSLARAGAEEDAIRDRFAAAVAAWNARDITTFMSYFSPSYLDDGDTKAVEQTDTQNDWEKDPGMQISYTSIDPVTVTGSTATAVVNWVGEGPDTEYLVKENGFWYVYGNQRKYGSNVSTNHQANHLWSPNDVRVDLQVEESATNSTITAVEVAGPGITGTISLNHQTGGGTPSWVSWGTSQQDDKSPTFTVATRPAVGAVYTFTIHDASGIVTQTAAILGYLDAFVTNLSPANGGVYLPPPANLTFSWTGLGAGYTYSVWCNGWNRDVSTDTSILYEGPTLVPGTRYQFTVMAHDENWSNSTVVAAFVYTNGNKYIATTGADLQYTEGNGAVAVDPGLVLTNNSGLDIGGATVSLLNYTPGDDVLGFANQNGITGNFSNGTLTLTGNANKTFYEAALRSVTYTNTSQNPTSQARFAVFLFTDTSAAASAPGQRDIYVTPVNDPPGLTTISTLTGGIKDTDFAITYSTLLGASDASDPDGPSLSFRIESVSSGTLATGRAAVVPGTTLLADGDSLVWSPPAGATGTLDAFTVKAWDGALASSATVQVRVQVLAPAAIVVMQGGNAIARNSPTPVSFGSVYSFAAAPELTFTIYSVGGGPLTVGGVSLYNNQGFTVSQQPTSPVNAGNSTTFRLQMPTATPGAMAADVSFVNGDTGSSPFTFKVSGTVLHGDDTDHNNMDDTWELHWFSQTGVDPNADPDGDGWSNRQEFERGTDPTRYVLSLKRGWNIIALARAPLDHSVATILGNRIVGPVYVWQDDHYEATTALEPLRGHWVYAPADAEIEITLP